MPEPFKNLISSASMTQLADSLFTGASDFPRDAFLAESVAGLAPLELKDRVRHVAGVLRRHLPADWDAALAVMLAGIGPPLLDTSELSTGFRYWPVLTAVELYGLDHPAASLAAIKEMTKRFSGEFAVRPYLIDHPEMAFAALTRWCEDTNPHVRRLASEGSRPRLPWGQQIPATVADPARSLALLQRLRDDPERYVQRSVANHLNDIAKDHPDTAAKVAKGWAKKSSRAWMVRHSMRTLLKQGHPGALAVMGYAPPKLTVTDMTATPATVALGGKVVLKARITSTASVSQRLMVDVIVGFVKKNGSRAPKVFKGSVRTLDAGVVWDLEKSISLRAVTTRKHYPGKHTLSVKINGKTYGKVSFGLTM